MVGRRLMPSARPLAAIAALILAAVAALILAAVAALILAAACSNPLRDTLETVVADSYAVGIRVFADGILLSDGMGIDRNSKLTFEFADSMRRKDVVLGGDLVAEGAEPVWSSRVDADDTVALSPKTVWGPGSSRSLSLGFRTGGSGTRSAIALRLGVLDGIVYVRALDGSDSNPGTADLPRRSVRKGIELAASYYASAEVRVAAGTYPGNCQQGTHVVLSPGISVLGGYDPTKWDNRDPAVFVSTIRDDSLLASDAYVSAVECAPGVGNGTLLEGFTIRGGGNSTVATSFGLRCKDAAPTLRGNTVIGGSGVLSVGVVVLSGSAIIDGCTIDGGAGVDSVGIYTKNCASGVLVEGNTITGGQGTNSRMGVQNYAEVQGGSAPVIRGNVIIASDGQPNFSIGVWNQNCDSLVEGNTIRAGSFYKMGIGIQDNAGSDSVIRNNLVAGGEGVYHGSLEAPDLAVGIDLGGDHAVVVNNTICGGAAGGQSAQAAAAGIYLEQSGITGETLIENNLIFTLAGNARYGIMELAAGVQPHSLANNDIFDCPTGLYTIFALDGQGHVVFVDMPADFAPYAWAANNISVDPLFVLKSKNASAAAADWHLTASSPAKGAGKAQADFTVDIEGTDRGASWSIGAYQ